jgi:hypothetical protein
MEYKLDSYRDEDGIKVTMVTKDRLTYLYYQMTERLIEGTRPDPFGAIQALQKKHPKRLQVITDNLREDYSNKGLREFEASIVAGFRKIGKWQE